MIALTVYADVLLVINLFVNYTLIACASGIMKASVSGFRIFLGAAVGSVYGLVIFLPKMPGVIEVIMRIAATSVIVLCSFGYGGIKRYLRSFFIFAAVSLIFGGLMLVLWLTIAPIGMVYSNGAVYFDIDLKILAVSTVVCFATVSLVSYFISRKAPRESVAEITVGMGDKKIKTNALIDTGNSLNESFSNYPVCVAELEVMKSIAPDAAVNYLFGKIPEGDKNIRLILHNTVSGTGVLPAFKPDYIEVKTVSGKYKTDKIYIAITKNSIAGGEYGMILNPEILKGENLYAETI